jgi:hypothetical protein
MKKLMSILLGLSLVIGAASIGFAADEKKEEKKESKKKGKKKKNGEEKKQ